MSRPVINNRIKSPCLNCEQRSFACWGECANYKQYKNAISEQKQMIYENNNPELRAYIRDGVTKRIRFIKTRTGEYHDRK